MSVLNLLQRTISVVTFKQILKKYKNFIRNYNDIPFEDIPEVSPSVIKKALNNQKISFDEGFTCFTIFCSICKKKPTKINKKNLYINKTTGMYMCASCKNIGQWSSLMHFFETNSRNNNKDETVDLVGQKLTESLKEIKAQNEELKCDNYENILRQSNLPVVSFNVIKNLDLRIDKNVQNLYFPLENIDSDIVGYRKIGIKTAVDVMLPDIKYGGLLIGRALKNKDSAILVPNISDLLVLLNAKVTQNVVCLPNGVNSLSQYFLPTLERFNKLILWFGNDVRSWDSARHFAKKLGEHRCYFVRPSEKQLLPHLVKSEDFKSIISSAQPVWHKSITSFVSLREEVYSDFRNVDKVEGVKWKRFTQLNKILKGHRRGELTVITGPTGCGKTTLISEYSLDLAMQGVNTLWGSFEIRNVRLARTMVQQFAGMSLYDNINLFDSIADNFEKLPIYFMTFHGQQTIKVVMDAIEHATYVHDIAHVIIDNVQFMMGITEDYKNLDRFWMQDIIIAAFRTFATKKNCHVTLVIHPRKERDNEDLTTSSIFGGAKASQEADNVFIIQDKRLTSLRGKKYLQIFKNRYSGDLGVVPLEFDKASLCFSKKKKDEKKPKKTENSVQVPEET